MNKRMESAVKIAQTDLDMDFIIRREIEYQKKLKKTEIPTSIESIIILNIIYSVHLTVYFVFMEKGPYRQETITHSTKIAASVVIL